MVRSKRQRLTKLVQKLANLEEIKLNFLNKLAVLPMTLVGRHRHALLTLQGTRQSREKGLEKRNPPPSSREEILGWLAAEIKKRQKA